MVRRDFYLIIHGANDKIKSKTAVKGVTFDKIAKITPLT
jgi:hypothetical protein